MLSVPAPRPPKPSFLITAETDTGYSGVVTVGARRPFDNPFLPHPAIPLRKMTVTNLVGMLVSNFRMREGVENEGMAHWNGKATFEEPRCPSEKMAKVKINNLRASMKRETPDEGEENV